MSDPAQAPAQPGAGQPPAPPSAGQPPAAGAPQPQVTPTAGTTNPGNPPATTPAAAPPAAPASYDLKLPKESLLAEQAIERTAAFARERGLSQEVAQAVLERQNEAIASFVEGQKALLAAQSDQWLADCRQCKTYGGEAFKENAANVERLMDRFAAVHPAEAKELREFLRTTGYGNHPSFFRLMAYIAKSTANDKTVIGAGAPPPKAKTFAEAIYGSE